MNITEIASMNPISIAPDASAREAAITMRDTHVGCVIVATGSDDDRLTPVGVVTDRDLAIMLIAMNADPDEVTVQDIMSSDPLILSQGDAVEDAIEMMNSHAVRRAPIVDAKGFLIGVVSIEDLVSVISDHLQKLADLLFEGMEYERQRRP